MWHMHMKNDGWGMLTKLERNLGEVPGHVLVQALHLAPGLSQLGGPLSKTPTSEKTYAATGRKEVSWFLFLNVIRTRM